MVLGTTSYLLFLVLVDVNMLSDPEAEVCAGGPLIGACTCWKLVAQTHMHVPLRVGAYPPVHGQLLTEPVKMETRHFKTTVLVCMLRPLAMLKVTQMRALGVVFFRVGFEEMAFGFHLLAAAGVNDDFG